MPFSISNPANKSNAMFVLLAFNVKLETLTIVLLNCFE